MGREPVWRNTRQRYGAVAIALHWLMAILLVALSALGLYLSRLPDVGFDTWKITLIIYHKELGVLALAMASLRLAWRVGNTLPSIVETLPDWQQVLALCVHLCFYALMIALPVTGLLMSWAAGFPVSFLGFFELPNLIPQSDYLFRFFTEVHKWLGYLFVGLLLVHAGATLGHHIIYRDNTLRKMLPRASP